MKPIKFDLPLNGLHIANLKQLKENLTPEIFEPLRSGKLEKWLKVRNLNAHADQINTNDRSLIINDEKVLNHDSWKSSACFFKSICHVFTSIY